MTVSPSLLQDTLRSLEQLTLAQEAKLIPTTVLHRRQLARRTFHAMLHDPSITAEAVACFTQETEDCTFSSGGYFLDAGGLSTDQVSRIRSFCATMNILFPRTEYADTVYLLVQAFESVYQNAPSIIWNSTFVVATDLEYRPHASIRKLGEDCYCIVFGCYLLADLAMVSFTFYEILSEYRSGAKAPEGFSEAVASAGFIETFNGSFHRRQFPYVLAAVALGEQYRYAARFTYSLFVQYPARYMVFYQLTICFLVAHEIAHLINGDLVGEEPFFLPELAIWFDHTSDLCMLKHLSPSELKSFWEKYGSTHSRELAPILKRIESSRTSQWTG